MFVLSQLGEGGAIAVIGLLKLLQRSGKRPAIACSGFRSAGWGPGGLKDLEWWIACHQEYALHDMSMFVIFQKQGRCIHKVLGKVPASRSAQHKSEPTICCHR